MGNHALRKQLARDLKAAGHPPTLYVGNKHIAYRFFRASTLNEYLRKLSFKPGDVVNDCDGFNHEIKKLLPWIGYWSRNGRKTTYTLQMDQFEFTDGGRSCGCPSGVVPAWSVEKITKFHRPHTDEEIEKLKRNGWWTAKSQQREDRVRRGELLCDERGFKLPKPEEKEGQNE